MTISVRIVHDGWTKVNFQSTGDICNFGERDIYLRESENLPNALIDDGFILRPGDDAPFSLELTINLWARSIIAPSKVLISSGISRLEAVHSAKNEQTQETLSEIVKWIRVTATLLADMQGMNADDTYEDLE